jgi:hypothetical protein
MGGRETLGFLLKFFIKEVQKLKEEGVVGET